MKKGKGILMFLCVFSFFFLVTAMSPTLGMAAEKAKAPAVKARFEVNKMGDMSDFDPSNWANPTGDTIKIAVVGTFSGPAAAVGEGFWLDATWAAYDYNKRGGIMVDGKKKLIQLFKADTMSRPDQAKKICEQMVLQEGVKFLWGADGSHIVKVMNQTAEKYKVISVNFISLAEELQDAQNFSRYAFMTWWQTSQVGRAFAYFYGQIRKKEKKFYILGQDYMFGHDMAENFKKGLKEYYPEAQVVGEDFHKLFQTDYAPYISKIKASGAEVVYTGDWDPDGSNLLKQSRAMGLNIPFAHIYLTTYSTMADLGVEATKGLQLAGPYYGATMPWFKAPGYKKYWDTMQNAYKRFKAPYNNLVYSQGWDPITMEFYWLLSVIERAQSTDPEKIIKTWEGDTYQYVNGHVKKMRPCDHNTIQDLYITEYVPPAQQKVAMNIPPYKWTDKCSWWGNTYLIPAEKVLPWMDPKLERCKGKNPAGD
jgi:ABC-type branched-subunit amino acid transport system substrate-binding protein